MIEHILACKGLSSVLPDDYSNVHTNNLVSFNIKSTYKTVSLFYRHKKTKVSGVWWCTALILAQRQADL